MLINKIEDALMHLSRYTLGKTFPDYCDLRTVIGLTADDKVRHPSLDAPYIQVTRNNDYVTCFEIKGAFREFSFHEVPEGTEPEPGTFQFFIRRLSESLSGEFRQTGHKLSVIFESDPLRGAEETERLLTPKKQACQRLHLALDDLIDEEMQKIAPYVARERVLLVVYTAFSSLPPEERRAEIKRQNETTQLPEARFGQLPLYAMFEGLKMRHDAFIDKLAADIADNNDGVLLRMMDAHETGQVIRDEIERNSTSTAWQPLLPGDRVLPHGRLRENDISACLAPHLNFQYCNSNVETDGEAVRVDDIWHGQLAMTLAPQRPQTFPELFRTLPRQLPWRLRIDLMPGGLHQLGRKMSLLMFLAIFPSLRPQYESVKWLLDRDRIDPVMVMSITASTWHRDKSRMQRNLTLLKKSLQGWGITDVTGIFGDPIRAWVSTLPAVSSYSGPNLLFAPLTEALRFLPLQRPCSPWEKGNFVVITPDGKPFVIQLASSLQEKHTEMIFGSPGSGKSVLANSIQLAMLANSNTDLPFMAFIDKGFTAQGVYELIRDALPPEQRHKVLSIVLQNDDHHCRNPMDIQLGLKAPLSTEREYILNLLKSLCADPLTGLPPDASTCADILGRAVDMAYQEKAERPTRYGPGLVPDVDAALQEADIFSRHPPEWWETATWYEIRDLLFDSGFVKEAAQAQAQAVPLLNDLQNELNNPVLRNEFEKVTRPGSHDLLLDYISRCLTRALTDYPMLSGRTQLVVNPETRIIVVDVNNVAGNSKTPEGKLRTGIMYQFARQLAGGNDFYLPQIQSELYASLDPRYIPLHRQRIEQLDQETKTIFMDEMHNIKGIQILWEALQTEDREQRKFGVRTVFASQYPDDVPEDMLRSANSVYLMRVRPQDFELLEKNFSVPRVTLNRMLKTPAGPAPDGSGTTFLGIFRTQRGNVAQILRLPVGPLKLWALNSTPENRALRNLLTQKLGSAPARRLLATHFPQGSASAHIDNLKSQSRDDDHTSAVNKLAAELIARHGYLQG
ncbi:TPA: ATP-binding protein [Escherichia coli]|uniref:conjugal transfer protein n=1 Tax=Escherichia coli TaxID=562 RepID=UPI000BE318B8|nr:conjugal transfer protein [Escherichia coli]EIY9855688.1 ATP-binding protein [Escherichia coli]ELH6622747.1 ATP-binding protein [Escherichia coli]ELK9438638.1 ATP-binding protein [Escherichia coli]ELO4948860.1 ATP-binding protein [Escherichia coli]ELO4958091.1 ATP-binding protein [Escherichia coli]